MELILRLCPQHAGKILKRHFTLKTHQMFSFHTKTQSWHFQIPMVWRAFSWASFLWQISVDGRPNSGNRAAFRNFSALMWTGRITVTCTSSICLQLLCRHDTLLLKHCVTNLNNHWEKFSGVMWAGRIASMYVFYLLKLGSVSPQLLCRHDTLLLKHCVTNSNNHWEGDKCYGVTGIRK